MTQKNKNKSHLDAEYQRNLFQATLDLQEKERKRIAFELHEKVGALLSAARLNLGMILSRTTPENEIENAVNETKQMIDETIESVRVLTNNLVPTSLEQFGLSRALNDLCADAGTPQTRVIYNTIGNGDLSLNRTQELLLYRITQELVNNALKHAQASVIEVNLISNATLTLSVADNGRGFDMQKTKEELKKGLGLYDIENRVRLLNASIDFKYTSGEGTTINITLTK